MRIVNLELVSHPMNWLTLGVWIISLSILAHVIGVIPHNVAVVNKKTAPPTVI